MAAFVSTAALDPMAVRRSFDRAARSVDTVDVLAREVARRMSERLEYMRIEPARLLDAGCGTGRDAEALLRRFPNAQWIGSDLSPAMLDRAHARVHRRRGLRAWLTPAPRPPLFAATLDRLPLAAASVGLVWSNLALSWVDSTVETFVEWHRVVEIGGLVMFSTYGPDTLKELRAAAGARAVLDFPDMHDLGDQLVAAGFADPVMDAEVITLEYADLDRLFEDLRRSGQGNVRADRRRGLSTRGWKRTLDDRYRAMQGSSGALPASFEIVYGHAWRVASRRTSDGRAIVAMPQRRR